MYSNPCVDGCWVRGEPNTWWFSPGHCHIFLHPSPEANPWSTEASTAASEAEKPQVGLIQWWWSQRVKMEKKKSDECCLGMKFHRNYDVYICIYIYIRVYIYIAHICNCCFKKCFWHSHLEWNNSFKSSNRRQICSDMLRTSWCFIFRVTGMTHLRFFVAVTINPWTVLLDQSQKGPRFKVASLQKLGHFASVVVVISMRVQYILEVIEDPIIWNVSFSLNWGVKCSSSSSIFRDVYLVILFRKYELPQAYKRYLFGCVLWFVSPTSEHQLPTWSVWIQVNVLAGAELVGVCSVTWSYPKVDLKRGKWFQVLLMVRHGTKWWSRYIGSSQQGSHTSDLRLQKNYITRPDAGKHLALSFTRKKKQHQQWQHRGGLYLVDVAQVSFSLSQVWGADRRQARWRWGWETLAAMKGYHGNVAEI